MSTHALQSHAQKLVAVMMIFVAALLSSCGLSDKEKSVARTNVAIEDVAEAGRQVANSIAALSGQTPDERDIRPVRDATRLYMERMETLNASIRQLAEVFTGLADYVETTFLENAERAAVDCQDALNLISGDSPDDEQIRSAITRIGRCIDVYADEVTRVSARYAEVSN